jgi:excisionase family DNA binding protein
MVLFGKICMSKEKDLPHKYLTAKDVAELLVVDERTVRRYADRGELPGYKVMGKWRFDPKEIHQYILSKRSHQPEG